MSKLLIEFEEKIKKYERKSIRTRDFKNVLNNLIYVDLDVKDFVKIKDEKKRQHANDRYNYFFKLKPEVVLKNKTLKKEDLTEEEIKYLEEINERFGYGRFNEIVDYEHAVIASALRIDEKKLAQILKKAVKNRFKIKKRNSQNYTTLGVNKERFGRGLANRCI
jgi:hypothetical protein